MGTPDFAAHILKELCLNSEFDVVGAYCQPDRPAGRGKKLFPPAVKKIAQDFNVPVFQPLNFKKLEDIETLRGLCPDFLVVAAYGLILPEEVLNLPRFAPINIHASLLPLYRGAAPIQRAIMDCHDKTGISIMHMEASLDTGPVYAMQSLNIDNHTAATLHDELAIIGIKLLTQVLHDIVHHGLKPIAQDENIATYAPKLFKFDGIINWHKPATFIHAQIRGVTPWPGAQVSVLRHEKNNIELRLGPGTIGPLQSDYEDFFANFGRIIKPSQFWLLEKDVVAISTLDNFYLLHDVKPSNKSFMSAAEFARGYFSSKPGFLADILNPL